MLPGRFAGRVGHFAGADLPAFEVHLGGVLLDQHLATWRGARFVRGDEGGSQTHQAGGEKVAAIVHVLESSGGTEVPPSWRYLITVTVMLEGYCFE